MSKFKVGDYVICINDKDMEFITYGKIYKVLECYNSNVIIIFRNNKTKGSYSNNRFKLAPFCRTPLYKVMHKETHSD